MLWIATPTRVLLYSCYSKPDIEDVDNQRIDLPYARDKTPTTGNEITAVQQLLGNLGRFNRAPEE